MLEGTKIPKFQISNKGAERLLFYFCEIEPRRSGEHIEARRITIKTLRKEKY
jgi:hypothetical protein